MKTRGFTMIELLAIITVLAAILLVSFPTLINMTRKDKERQYNDMVTTLCKSGETYIYDNEDMFPGLGTEGNSIYIELDDLINYGLVKNNEINPKTNNNLFGRLEYIVQADKSLKCNFNPSLCTLVEDSDEDGKVSLGDKYACRVKYGTIYNFYVLSIEGKKINLIMDSNICNDGTNNYDRTGYCRYAWSETENNDKGPITAMEKIYEATKDWDRVQNIIMEYKDEENKYDKIEVTNEKMEIFSKDGTSYTINYEEGKQLKSRLPKYSEMLNTGCTTSKGSCPSWIVDNVMYYDVTEYVGYDKYEQNKNIMSEGQNHISGYWLMSASDGSSSAYTIDRDGYISRSAGVSSQSSYGVRPVIDVLKSDISN